MEELNRSHVNYIERGIKATFDKVITLPVMRDGKDSGITIYVGLTNIGKFVIGPVSDELIKEVASRLSLGDAVIVEILGGG